MVLRLVDGCCPLVRRICPDRSLGFGGKSSVFLEVTVKAGLLPEAASAVSRGPEIFQVLW